MFYIEWIKIYNRFIENLSEIITRCKPISRVFYHKINIKQSKFKGKTIKLLDN